MTSRDDVLKPFDLEDNEPYVICWRDLDSATAAEELNRLTSWVDWLTSRYNLDHKLIPPCWSEHGALVEELSALHSRDISGA